MFNVPNMPTDMALARLSENDLYTQRKEALEALNEAKQNGYNTTELGRAFKALDDENTRRINNRRMR
jgi:Ca2+-binding EF-hand superfamily protein